MGLHATLGVGMPEWHSVQFVWPRLLWGLAFMPLGWGLYLAWQRTKTRHTHAWLGLDARATSDKQWHRHAPVALQWVGLTILLVAIARPQAILLLPSRIDTVMLAAFR